MLIKNFQEYVKLYVAGDQHLAYEKIDDHWEIAIAASDSGDFQQVSFVNSIATTEGGTHVSAALAKTLNYLKNICEKVW